MCQIIDHFLFFSTAISGNTITLSQDETSHAVSVLRLQRGDKIFITNGKGMIYFGKIVQIDKKICQVALIQEKIQEPQKPGLDFYLGIPEKNAFESVLTALVPLGIMNIIPVECAFCQNKWWSKKWEKHDQRFYNKMIAAAKQSWNAWLPKLHHPIPFAQAIDLPRNVILVADEQGNTLTSLKDMLASCSSFSCFIGPPGGLSPHEMSALKSKDAIALTVSSRRLKTELAATVLAGNLIQLTG